MVQPSQKINLSRIACVEKDIEHFILFHIKHTYIWRRGEIIQSQKKKMEENLKLSVVFGPFCENK